METCLLVMRGNIVFLQQAGGLRFSGMGVKQDRAGPVHAAGRRNLEIDAALQTSVEMCRRCGTAGKIVLKPAHRLAQRSCGGAMKCVSGHHDLCGEKYRVRRGCRKVCA
jgi:hypothetical protein